MTPSTSRAAFPVGTIIGYPRIGRRRELKKAVEAFWAGDTTADELELPRLRCAPPPANGSLRSAWGATMRPSQRASATTTRCWTLP